MTTREKLKAALFEIREIGQQVRTLGANLPPESSLQYAAFNLAHICGELEARVAAEHFATPSGETREGTDGGNER